MLTLTPINAYTINSSDNEWASSDKGIYQDYNIACIKSKKCGWYGSDGNVKAIEVWKDENNNLYKLIPLGKFLDVEEEYKNKLIQQIKNKLTEEELKLLDL